MPIFEHGYRHYEGPREGKLQRILVIAQENFKHSWTSPMLRRIVFLSWTPFLYLSVVFFIIGKLTGGDGVIGNLLQGLMLGWISPELTQTLLQAPETVRLELWRVIFFLFVSKVQIWPAFFVTTIVSHNMISQDIRYQTYPLYMSRPLSKLDYIIGKLLGAMCPVMLVTVVPAVMLYVISILFSPDFSTVVDTWPILLSIAGYCFLILVPFLLMIMALSTFTTNDRFVAFAWISVVVLSAISGNILYASLDQTWTSFISLASLYKQASYWVLQLPAPTTAEAGGSDMSEVYALIGYPEATQALVALLAGMAVISLFLIFRKLRSLERR